eukprot:scaffold10866_cov124-Isochrysis_galbana.AAC.4
MKARFLKVSYVPIAKSLDCFLIGQFSYAPTMTVDRPTLIKKKKQAGLAWRSAKNWTGPQAQNRTTLTSQWGYKRLGSGHWPLATGQLATGHRSGADETYVRA